MRASHFVTRCFEQANRLLKLLTLCSLYTALGLTDAASVASSAWQHAVDAYSFLRVRVSRHTLCLFDELSDGEFSS